MTRLIGERLPEFDLVVVESALAYMEVLHGPQFVAVVAAQDLTWAEGIDVLAHYRRHNPHVPLILLANDLSTELVHRAVQARIGYQLQNNTDGMLALVGLLEEAKYRPGSLALHGGLRWVEFTREAPVATVTLTEEGNIYDVNNAFKLTFGIREWDGQNLLELLPDDQPMTPLRELLAGDRSPLRVNLRDANGDPRGFVLTAWSDHLSDMTNVLILDNRTIAGSSEFDPDRDEGEEMRQLIYAISHDLQEPLQLASRYARLLADDSFDDLDEDGKRSLDNLQRSTTKGQEILDGLLEFSRLEHTETSYEPVALNEVVDEIFSLYQLTIDEIGAKVSRGDLPRVYADRKQLARVFQNLIGNAIKFRSEKPLRVLVTARDYGPAWCLVIRDNGIGIQPDQRSRAFELFQRLHSKEGIPGTGMGLAICRRIVERHGGRIWLKSLPGKGSAFYFTLHRQLD